MASANASPVSTLARTGWLPQADDLADAVAKQFADHATKLEF